MRIFRRFRRRFSGLFSLLVIVLAVWGVYSYAKSNLPNIKESISSAFDTAKGSLKEASKESDATTEDTKSTALQADSKRMSVHFIDVGQGDCELIVIGKKTMLIDCGEYEQVDKVEDYLKGLGIEKLDVVVATHPHTDHIGGMGQIISDFKPDNVLLPDKTSDTVAYEKMLEAIAKVNANMVLVKEGDHLSLADAKIDILAPKEDSVYENLNNYSVVMKVTYGNKKFLFTGDAESAVETLLLGKQHSDGLDLSADVIKVPHHGSKTSSMEAFIRDVNPSVAVIEVGEGNSYGHPKEVILDRYKAAGVTIYRTDLNGTVVAITDGSNIEWYTEK